jgi:hypothetical protein
VDIFTLDVLVDIFFDTVVVEFCDLVVDVEAEVDLLVVAL